MSTWKIGKIGEQIVEEYLKSSNWLTYPAPNERHPIDWILATKDKRNICLADAKTKPRRRNYYDTGIDFRHYLEYEYLREKYNLDVLLIFVDPIIRKIYGNYLSNLTIQVSINGKLYPSRETTKQNREIIYFPLTNVRQISTISEEYAVELNNLSHRNYDYDNELDTEIVVQPALFNSPYKPKVKKRCDIQPHDNPEFLKRLLLAKCCQCGQPELSPNYHNDYCEYRILLNGKGAINAI